MIEKLKRQISTNGTSKGAGQGAVIIMPSSVMARLRTVGRISGKVLMLLAIIIIALGFALWDGMSSQQSNTRS